MIVTTLDWIKELLRLNKKSESIGFGQWEQMCKDTDMLDGQLKNTIICLLDSMSKRYINSQIKIKELENKVSILESDIKTLKNNQQAGEYELNRGRLENGIKLASKPQASKEVIEALRERGLTYDEIASTLNISRSTAWRHLK